VICAQCHRDVDDGPFRFCSICRRVDLASVTKTAMLGTKR
jgi:hypothetical protein